jgi:nicotinate-nucleotide--dimethylbenzimidazole phosphoribosyltransferase
LAPEPVVAPQPVPAPEEPEVEAPVAEEPEVEAPAEVAVAVAEASPDLVAAEVLVVVVAEPDTAPEDGVEAGVGEDER